MRDMTPQEARAFRAVLANMERGVLDCSDVASQGATRRPPSSTPGAHRDRNGRFTTLGRPAAH